MALCATLVAAPAAAAAPDAVGGGFTDAGIEGAYYANPNLEGTPSFIRRDVRIDFDWGELRPIGGSTAEPYRSFPRDQFSIRWRGRVIPRFGETYTFLGEAHDGIRIKIRGPGQQKWTTLVDRWNEAGPFQSTPIALSAGQSYDILVDFRETQGAAQCTLKWKSKSTPVEVIDPVVQQGVNAASWGNYVWANLMKSARYGEKGDLVDKDGWPTTDGTTLIMSEMDSTDVEMKGTYLLRFRGRAQVRQTCCGQPVFRAGGRRFESVLPAGAGYDLSTNTTSSSMTVLGSRTMLSLENTRRNPGSRGDGVTEITLMRPVALGSKEHHRHDEIVYRPFKRVVSDHFTALRWLSGANRDTEKDWSQRTSPDQAFFIDSRGQENWEYLILLSNETGKDLYLTTPIEANDEYFEKLALLLRYGSDGNEPYQSPQAEPRYPPLNPNLRVYLEVGNEIWNWVFASTQVAQRVTRAEHDARSATWEAIDYDGQAGKPARIKAMRRWHAVRTVQASNVFRRVWKDDAMGSRVRILMEYQYDNFQDTAVSSLDFIDGYYNNRSTTNVSDPHPVSYYLWGAGGAAYYGLANGTGQQAHTLFRDASFEAVTIESGTLRFRPRDSAWSFKGQAGLIRPEGAKHINAFNNLPTPSSGKQAAFLSGTGSISQKIRFAEPGTYVIAFSAAGSAEGWPGHQPFDVLVDGRKVSPRRQHDLRLSQHGVPIRGRGRNINSLEGQYGSAVFQIGEPGLHTVAFVGRDEAANYLLVDDVRIVSADAIMTSGFDKGTAIGQEGDPDFAYQLETQARYARSFGLQVVAYESGWSLGGDFHQVPLQIWCKLHDPRATNINDQAMRLWDRSGSFMLIWGVHLYWPSYDFAGAGTYSIMQSFRGATQRLRDEPTYGRPLPTVLRLDSTDWSYSSKTEQSWWRRHVPCSIERTDQWHAWMLIAPTTGTYTFRVSGRGSGRLVVEVDGEPIGELSSLEQSVGAPLTVKLTKGAHGVRAVIGCGIELDGIEVSQAGR